MQRPKVTVFMAVYNGEKYIADAITSVLQQSFKDFELLIINDGSSDNSVSIIKTFLDERIRLLNNETNLGLFRTRNRGIEEAKGKYFATLDCDDVAFKNRLELQVQYFFKNKDAVVNGGRIKYINHNSKVIGNSAPVRGDQDYLKSLLLFTNFFINSTTMINTSVLKKLMYRKGFEPAEDYDLFERISSDYKIGMMSNMLSYYRVHSNNTSEIKSYNRKIAEKEIIERQLLRYGFVYNNEELNIHLKFTTAEFDLINPQDCRRWFKNLINQNAEKKKLNHASFQKAVARQWLRLCMYNLKAKHNINPLLKTGAVKKRYLINSFLRSL